MICAFKKQEGWKIRHKTVIIKYCHVIVIVVLIVVETVITDVSDCGFELAMVAVVVVVLLIVVAFLVIGA